MTIWPLRAWIAAGAVVAVASVAAGAHGVASAHAAPRVYTVAGTGEAGARSTGLPATDATLSLPSGVAVAADGSVLVADSGNNRVRRISRSGVVTVVAGTGATAPVTDGVPATSSALVAPVGISAAPGGGFLIAETGGHRVRRVDASGIVSTVAGVGTPGFSGDGGGANVAQLNAPTGVLALPDGNILIADTGNHRIRLVSPLGVITTFAGNGEAAFAGDRGLAVQAALNGPRAAAVTADGAVLIADAMNRRVRRVGPDGVITTVAGGGRRQRPGPALAALLDPPTDVAVRRDGVVLIAGGTRVRRLERDGSLRTVAGGRPGALGDGGDPRRAGFVDIAALALPPEGGYLIADPRSHKVRLVIDASGRRLRRLAASFASEGFGAVAGEEVRIRVASTRRAGARLRVARRANYRRALREGVVAFTIRAPRRPGRYRLRLVATGGRQTVTDYALLRVGRAPPDGDPTP